MELQGWAVQCMVPGTDVMFQAWIRSELKFGGLLTIQDQLPQVSYFLLGYPEGCIEINSCIYQQQVISKLVLTTTCLCLRHLQEKSAKHQVWLQTGNAWYGYECCVLGLQGWAVVLGSSREPSSLWFQISLQHNITRIGQQTQLADPLSPLQLCTAWSALGRGCWGTNALPALEEQPGGN